MDTKTPIELKGTSSSNSSFSSSRWYFGSFFASCSQIHVGTSRLGGLGSCDIFRAVLCLHPEPLHSSSTLHLCHNAPFANRLLEATIRVASNSTWDSKIVYFQGNLAGGNWFCFSFTPKIVEMIQLDEHIFQIGWNHQLEIVGKGFLALSPAIMVQSKMSELHPILSLLWL